MAIVIPHHPHIIFGVILARRVTRRQPRRHIHRPQQHHHRRREIVAIPRLRLKQEIIHPVRVARRRLDLLRIGELLAPKIFGDGVCLVIRIVRVLRKLRRLIAHALRQRQRQLQIVIRDECIVIRARLSQIVVSRHRHIRHHRIRMVFGLPIRELPRNDFGRGDILALQRHRVQRGNARRLIVNCEPNGIQHNIAGQNARYVRLREPLRRIPRLP